MNLIRLDTEVTEDNLKQYVLWEVTPDEVHPSGVAEKVRQRLTADAPWYALQAALDMAAHEGWALTITKTANLWLKDRNPDRPETNRERIERLEDELERQRDIVRRDPLRRSVYDEHNVSQESQMFNAAAGFAALPGRIPVGATPADLANVVIGTIRKLRTKLNEPVY